MISTAECMSYARSRTTCNEPLDSRDLDVRMGWLTDRLMIIRLSNPDSRTHIKDVCASVWVPCLPSGDITRCTRPSYSSSIPEVNGVERICTRVTLLGRIYNDCMPQ